MGIRFFIEANVAHLRRKYAGLDYGQVVVQLNQRRVFRLRRPCPSYRELLCFQFGDPYTNQSKGSQISARCL